MPISAPSRPKIPIYVGRDAEGDITNHMVMAKTKLEEKHLAEDQNSPKKKNWLDIHLSLLRKTTTKNQ